MAPWIRFFYLSHDTVQNLLTIGVRSFSQGFQHV